MSMERAKAHLQKKGFLDRVIEPEVQTATVAEAAAALGCAESHIAKTLSFYDGEGTAILILAAGDAKIDNRKFKDKFGRKAKMLAAEDVEPMTGHAIGGVCPFGVNEGVQVYCDESLKRFDYVYPAAGNAHSGVKLTCEELFGAADALEWIDVCKGWEEN
ncbi:MAG: YbaK/EbsC family protein [Butyricicoccus sp.]|nr:YbaK/EbsC family protein [Butyricicoccus sp.]